MATNHLTPDEELPHYASAVRGSKDARQRPDFGVQSWYTTTRSWLKTCTKIKGVTANLNKAVNRSGAAESGWVWNNRRLNSFAESNIVNVGDCS
jgi:hypothetical protein